MVSKTHQGPLTFLAPMPLKRAPVLFSYRLQTQDFQEYQIKHQLCSVCEMLSRWAEGGLKGAGCGQVSLSVACQRRENCHRKMQTTPIEYP